MIRAVLDTNVLASGIVGLRHPASTPGALFLGWRIERFTLITSVVILQELQRTLNNPYFSRLISDDDIREALHQLRRRSRTIVVTEVVERVATHSEDDLILATAVSGEADYLVTGDRALQRLGRYAGVEIVSPREFLEILDRSEDL